MKSLRHVQLLATPWTAAYQAPLSMGFSRQEYWSGSPVPSPNNWWVGFKLEKAMAPHSSTLAWKIPWAEEPGGLHSMGSLRVRHDWATSLSLFTFLHWRRKWQPTPVFLPGESQGRLPSMGSHRVGHDWSDLAAAAAAGFKLSDYRMIYNYMYVL